MRGRSGPRPAGRRRGRSSESHPVREPPHRGRRGRGGVFDLAMGVGKAMLMEATFFMGGGRYSVSADQGSW